MNRQTMEATNAIVEAGRKEILALMKAKGYRQTTIKASALYETRFEFGAKQYAIDGWHGTGKRGTCRWFGDQKSIFKLYDCNGALMGFGHVAVALDDNEWLNDRAITPQAQKKVIDDIIAYLANNA